MGLDEIHRDLGELHGTLKTFMEGNDNRLQGIEDKQEKLFGKIDEVKVCMFDTKGKINGHINSHKLFWIRAGVYIALVGAVIAVGSFALNVRQTKKIISGASDVKRN